MRTPLTGSSRWWSVPVALCAVLAVGCSTVGGSASGDGASQPASISVVAPSVLDPEPSEVASSPPSEPAVTDPADTDSADTDPPTTEPTTAPTTAPNAAPSTASSTGPLGGTPGPSVSASEDPDPPSAPPLSTATGRLLDLEKFQSPSLNIGCLIEDGLSVRCDLQASDIPEKHDCEDGGDWGQAVALDRGRKAEMLCASDTVVDPDAPVLAYGSSTRVGSMTCTSSQDGMACSDDLGHGFRLSRSSYDVR